MKKKIIGIDLDDTITDIQDEMKEYASVFDQENNGHGIVNPNKYLVGEMYNWSDEMKNKFFSTYRKNIIMHARVRQDVEKIFSKWQSLGYKIIIITARNSKYYDNPYLDTYKWLKEHNVPFDELIVESKNKKEICYRLNIDYFVDDMPNNCISVNELENVQVFIMHNGNNNCNNKEIFRINNFEEMDNIIKKRI